MRIKSARGGKRVGAGRKKGAVTIATQAEKSDLEGRARKYTDVALNALVAVATHGESETARVSAASVLLDRGYGKARQAVEHTGKDGAELPPAQVWIVGGSSVQF